MSQRWFQKVGVQTAVVTTVGTLIVAAVYVFWGPRGDTIEVSGDRPSASVQKVEDSPSAIVQDMQNSPGGAQVAIKHADRVDVHASPPARTIPTDAQQKAVERLKAIPKLTVQISSVMGNSETFGLAQQLKSIFIAADWPITKGGISQAVFKESPRQCKFTFQQEPPPELQAVCQTLLKSLRQKEQLYLDPALPEGTLKIIVGEQ